MDDATCDTCGAVLQDEAKHRRWHEANDRASSSEAPAAEASSGAQPSTEAPADPAPYSA